MLSAKDKLALTNHLNRVNKHKDYQKLRDEPLDKASHPKGIIFPVGMIYNHGKAWIYQMKDAALWFGWNMKEQKEYRESFVEYEKFMLSLVKKYNCKEVDWDSFEEKVKIKYRLRFSEWDLNKE